MHHLALFVVLIVLAAGPAPAQQADIRIAVPSELVDSGLMQYILPRFSLKTAIRVEAGKDGALQIVTEPPGTPVFSRGGTNYYLRAAQGDKAARFRDWLTGPIGRRTVEAFVPAEGGQGFTMAPPEKPETDAPDFVGDAARGHALAREHCGRCHVVDEANRMRGIGSTPSFAVLRALPGWVVRFESFYARNPHGAYTVIEGVTPSFDITSPPPIARLELTLDDLDDIMAYAATVPPADLGAPIQYQ